MSLKTADLCDQHAAELKIAEPIFRSYGGNRAFHGQIATVRVFEDNVLVKERLSSDGRGQVLIVDGGGSLRCALLGDVLAGLAAGNGWSGVILYGCVRDADQIDAIPIGVRALNTTPRKSKKEGAGEEDVPVSFAGITFRSGDYVYADRDGIVVSARCYAV